MSALQMPPWVNFPEDECTNNSNAGKMTDDRTLLELKINFTHWPRENLLGTIDFCNYTDCDKLMDDSIKRVVLFILVNRNQPYVASCSF